MDDDKEQFEDIAIPYTESTVEPSFEIPCKKAEALEQSMSGDLKLIVSDPEKSPNLSFLISIYPHETSIRRTFEEFLLLRGLLMHQFPASFVPPALPKRIKGNSKEESMSKHVRFANKFLASIVAHPLLRTSEHFYGFLFRDIAKASINKPESVEEFVTLEGVAHCDPNRNPENTKKVLGYLESSLSLQRTLKRQSQKLEKNLKATAETLSKISENLKQLERLQEMMPENAKSKEVLRNFDEIIASWCRSELEKVKTTKEFISGLFKYTYNESKPMLELLKNKDNAYKTFSKLNNKIYSKKEKLWLQGDVTKWKLDENQDMLNIEELKNDKDLALSKMLRNDTLKVKRLKELHAHFNFKLFEEMSWLLSYKTDRDVKNFKLMCEKQMLSHSRVIEAWNACFARFNELE